MQNIPRSQKEGGATVRGGVIFRGNTVSVANFTTELAILIQWSPLNSHGKCADKSCELSEHGNYLSLFYVK